MPDNPTIPAAAVEAAKAAYQRGRDCCSGLDADAHEMGLHAVLLSALPHLAAPADVAGMVARLRAGEACADNPCRAMDARSGCICAEAADRLTALSAAYTALLTGERVIVPQSQQHAESLYAVAVSSLRAYGVDPEAERDDAAELDVARQQTRAAIERATDALRERDALAERLRVIQDAMDLAVSRGCSHCADSIREARVIAGVYPATLTQASAPETGDAS